MRRKSQVGRRRRTVLEIVFKAAQRPCVFKAEVLHLLPGVGWREFAEIDLVQRSDQAGSVSANIAMKINRLITGIMEDLQDPIHVLF